MKASALALAAAIGFAVVNADAALITYDFTSGSATASTNTGSGYGNVRTFTAGGVTVTVTAWSLTGSSSTFESAQLGRFSTGLGTCNRSEGRNCGSPSHQVDNSGADDFVLFQFDAAVDPLSIRIDPWGNFDRDVSYWVGTVSLGLDLTGDALSSLAGLGFGARIDSTATASDNPRDVAINNGGLVNTILFGASSGIGDQDDYFKIKALKVDYAPPPPPGRVPEPGTLALFVVAIASLGMRRVLQPARCRS